MKIKLILPTLFLSLAMFGCNGMVKTKTVLILQPNEQYLVQNIEKEQQSKKLLLKEDAPDKVDYQFSISKTEIDQLDLINPNDLIIGRERVLLQPIAVNYEVENGVVTNNEVSRMTLEQTETNFVPIIEMSGSGYGNENISLNTYDIAQLRTCYAISNTDGVVQSKYYDISITVEDTIAPVALTDVLNLETSISYKTPSDNDASLLNLMILRNYTDNDSNTTLSVKYYSDESYETEITVLDAIQELRNNPNLISENSLQSLPVYYRVYDDNGNASNNGLAYVSLHDDVSPYIVDLDGNPVTEFGFGEKMYYPDAVNDLTEYIKDNFKVIDEVDGELNIDNAEISITSNGASLRIYDKELNELFVMDPNSKVDRDFTQDSYYVWYPYGANETTNSERGLKYRFFLNEELNQYEVELIGPNLPEGQYNATWAGTNGEGHLQIPEVVVLYNHSYRVTRIADRAFNNVKLINSLNDIPGGNSGQENVIDFSNTYISYIGERGITFSETTTNLKIIVDTLNDHIILENSAINAYARDSVMYVSKKVDKIDAQGVFAYNIYLEYTKEEIDEKEKNGDFYLVVNEYGFRTGTWYGSDFNLDLMKFNYNVTLSDFEDQFNIK